MGSIMKTIDRREFLGMAGKATIAGTAAYALASFSCTRAAARSPNIIFILADDLGYGDLGCYGQPRIKTPNIDRLASEGVRFTDCYAGSTVCAPSRCVLMTGNHSGHAYIRGNREARPMGQEPLLPGTVTIAHLLQRTGYATALIGKWGLGGPGSTGIPNKQGFDYFYGYLGQRHAHNYYPEFLFRNDNRIPLSGNRVENPRPDGAGVAIERTHYSHDLLAEDALTFIRQNKDRPFFLYLALTIPHANNEAGAQGMEVPSDEPYAHEDWPQPQKNHAAMITRMDRDVGRLMDMLKELGIDEDTIIFFSSDNGPHKEGGADPEFFKSSGPLRGFKRDLYEGGIRVPMLVRWPGRAPAGTVSDQLWAFWDFLPTAGEIAGVEIPGGIDGISMMPAIMGKEQKQQHEYLYWEFLLRRRGFRQAVRMGDWKAVRLDLDKPIELYNLKADVAETHDLAQQNPYIVSRMEEVFKQAHTDSELFPVSRD